MKTNLKLNRKSHKVINLQLVKPVSKEKILQPLLGRTTMSVQYRNKVLHRVRSRKDDYYFFYYLFYECYFYQTHTYAACLSETVTDCNLRNAYRAHGGEITIAISF